MVEKKYEPHLVAFICTYCTYTAADMAGSMRLQYPTSVRIIKLLCTGKVDVIHLLRAFEAGADAVLVSGCEIGDCHFIEGNLRARERVEHTQKLLDEIGLGRERLEMFHIGASDAPHWAEAVAMMHRRALQLGPNPLGRKRSGKVQPDLGVGGAL